MARAIKTSDDLTDQTRDALKTLQQHGAAAQFLLAKHRATLAAEYQNRDLNAEAIGRNVEIRRQAFAQEVAKLHQQAADAMATLKDAHTRARIKPSDPTAELLEWSKQQDGAQRGIKLVQSGVPLGKVIEDAGKSGDVHMLNGLKRHIPAELAQQEAAQPGIVAEHLKLIERAIMPHLPAVEQAVKRQEALLPKLEQATRWNADMLNEAAGSRVADPRRANFISVSSDDPDRTPDALPVGDAPAGLPRW